MYFKTHELKTAIDGAENQLKKIQQELDHIGSSRLVCRKQNNHIFFTEYLDKKERGITRNKTRIQQLARKEYLSEYSSILTANIDAMQDFSKRYIDFSPETIAEIVHKKHPNLPPETMLYPARDSWKQKPYEKNPYYEEDLQYYTTSGIVVRSKSEREIGNTLESMGIEYQNDIRIDCGKQHYYADFVIKRHDSSLLIWEHFGREHDKVYMAKNTVRIRDYIALGYRPWDNLIWTLDSDIKDSRNIRRIIKRFILL